MFKPFRGEQSFQPEPSKRESEQPPADKLMREWYNDTSWEGRSPREFEDVRREARKAPSLDFDRYFHDKDYQRLIHENPRMQQLMFEEEAVSLMALWDRRTQVGISPGQFEGLVSAFSPEAVKRFKRNVATEQALRSGYGGMSAEDAEEGDAAFNHRNARTIVSQKQKDDGQREP